MAILFLRVFSKNNIAVAVEPVFARNQEVLTRWMAGKISEQEFLDRIHYREEWGCDWEGYKRFSRRPGNCTFRSTARTAILEMTCAASAGAALVSLGAWHAFSQTIRSRR